VLKIQENQIEWWQAIIESINDGVLVIDQYGIVKVINTEYSRITGVTTDIIGKQLVTYRPGAQLPQTLKDGKSRVGVYRKIKNREYVVDMAQIIINDQIVGAVSICKSLTEVHTLARELKIQNEKLQELETRMNSIHSVKYNFDDLLGKEECFIRQVELAKKAAISELPILITGESGTGKELFSQSIHQESDRRDRPFIPVNCSAIPSNLMESELFGYVEGAFTGAVKGGKAGLFEMANTGTLFLDEIGDLSYEVQAKLLRVLQEGSIRRVGEASERKINVRIIAATHRNLEQLVSKKHFRGDLFYRLNVVNIKVPSLRERRKDIPMIIQSFLPTHPVYEIDDLTLSVISSYDWPGNIRELKNVIDYAVCMTDDKLITINHLPDVMRKNSVYRVPNTKKDTLKKIVNETEKEYIISTLERFGNTVKERKKVAEILGISLATLYNKMNQYELNN